MTESISSSPMAADRSMETKSPSSTARSTPLRVPKRSRSAVSRSSTSSSVAVDLVDLDGDALEVGQLDLGRTSTSTVNLRSWPSSAGTSVTSTSGWPIGADVARPRRPGRRTAGSASLTASCEHGAAADPLVDDPARDLALAEAGHLHLGADRLVRRVEARLQLLERHLDGQLDPGRVDGLDGTLHFGHSTTMGGIGATSRHMPCGPATAGPAPSSCTRARGIPDAPRDHASGRARGDPIAHHRHGCRSRTS